MADFERAWCTVHEDCWMYPCGHCRAYHTHEEIDDCFRLGLNIGGPREVSLD